VDDLEHCLRDPDEDLAWDSEVEATLRAEAERAKAEHEARWDR
jgi:hypothetical protein